MEQGRQLTLSESSSGMSWGLPSFFSCFFFCLICKKIFFFFFFNSSKIYDTFQWRKLETLMICLEAAFKWTFSNSNQKNPSHTYAHAQITFGSLENHTFWSIHLYFHSTKHQTDLLNTTLFPWREAGNVSLLIPLSAVLGLSFDPLFLWECVPPHPFVCNLRAVIGSTFPMGMCPSSSLCLQS